MGCKWVKWEALPTSPSEHIGVQIITLALCILTAPWVVFWRLFCSALSMLGKRSTTELTSPAFFCSLKICFNPLLSQSCLIPLMVGLIRDRQTSGMLTGKQEDWEMFWVYHLSTWLLYKFKYQLLKVEQIEGQLVVFAKLEKNSGKMRQSPGGFLH